MDRRAYQRILVDAEGVFILQDKNISTREFIGTIEDICEGGYKIVVDRKAFSHVLSHLSDKDIIDFNIYDEYSLFGNEVTSLVSGQAQVMRQELKGDLVYIGCKFMKVTSEIEQYVLERKTALYLRTIKKNEMKILEN